MDFLSIQQEPYVAPCHCVEMANLLWLRLSYLLNSAIAPFDSFVADSLVRTATASATNVHDNDCGSTPSLAARSDSRILRRLSIAIGVGVVHL